MSGSFDEALDFVAAPVIGVAAEPEELRVVKDGTLTYYPNLIQGSDKWYEVRRGLLTASEMKLVITPPPRPETRVKKDGTPYKQREWEPMADDDKCWTHLYELLGQRITQYVEPSYISDDMLRGKADEIIARDLYIQHYAPVEDMGFITNDEWGFTLGFSPDGLVGPNGFIETKSRRQKYGMQTIIEYVPEDKQPDEYIMQTMTGFLVSKREWCDFISFTGGLHMATIRIHPDPIVMNAIVEVAGEFERRLAEKLARYHEVLASKARLIPTERREITEMHL